MLYEEDRGEELVQSNKRALGNLVTVLMRTKSKWFSLNQIGIGERKIVDGLIRIIGVTDRVPLLFFLSNQKTLVLYASNPCYIGGRLSGVKRLESKGF